MPGRFPHGGSGLEITRSHSDLASEQACSIARQAEPQARPTIVGGLTQKSLSLVRLDEQCRVLEGARLADREKLLIM